MAGVAADTETTRSVSHLYHGTRDLPQHIAQMGHRETPLATCAHRTTASTAARDVVADDSVYTHAAAPEYSDMLDTTVHHHNVVSSDLQLWRGNAAAADHAAVDTAYEGAHVCGLEQFRVVVVR